MDIPYTQNYISLEGYLPNTFKYQRQVPLSTISPHLESKYVLQEYDDKHDLQFVTNPEQDFRRGFEQRSIHNKKKKKEEKEMMSNLKNSLMDIKEDVNRLIEDNNLYEEC